jgi:hypothetical protein
LQPWEHREVADVPREQVGSEALARGGQEQVDDLDPLV